MIVLVLERLKPPQELAPVPPVGPGWKPWLEVHAAFGFFVLILLGDLINTHIVPAFRTGEKRGSGLALLGSLVVLILTAYGLYYVGNDKLRAGMENVHIWL